MTKQKNRTQHDKNSVNKSEVIRRARQQIRETDPYWQQPLPFRIYLRVILAGFWFLLISYLFDMMNASTVVQAIMGSVAAIGALMFRMAYPGGITDALGMSNVFPRALAEANKELQKQQEEEIKHITSPGGLRDITSYSGGTSNKIDAETTGEINNTFPRESKYREITRHPSQRNRKNKEKKKK